MVIDADPNTSGHPSVVVLRSVPVGWPTCFHGTSWAPFWTCWGDLKHRARFGLSRRRRRWGGAVCQQILGVQEGHQLWPQKVCLMSLVQQCWSRHQGQFNRNGGRMWIQNSWFYLHPFHPNDTYVLSLSVPILNRHHSSVSEHFCW